MNGSLSQRQFRVATVYWDEGYDSIAAAWCDSAFVYAMGTDLKFYGFKISGDDSEGNGGTWNVVWQSDSVETNVAFNIASVCLLPADGPPPLFINAFDGNSETGSVTSVLNNSEYHFANTIWSHFLLRYSSDHSAN